MKNNTDNFSIDTHVPTTIILPQQQIIYVEGFFVSDRMQVCRDIHDKYCADKNRLFSANLSAEYIIKEFPKEINYLADHSDILFGNRSEFQTLTEVNGFKTLTDQVNSLNAKNLGKTKIILITNGAQFVDIYVRDEDNFSTHNRLDVIAVDKADIVDTTGAGDSFVAGFLFAYLQSKSTIDCAQFGIEIASKKIRAVGATLN